MRTLSLKRRSGGGAGVSTSVLVGEGDLVVDSGAWAVVVGCNVLGGRMGLGSADGSVGSMVGCRFIDSSATIGWSVS